MISLCAMLTKTKFSFSLAWLNLSSWIKLIKKMKLKRYKHTHNKRCNKIMTPTSNLPYNCSILSVSPLSSPSSKPSKSSSNLSWPTCSHTPHSASRIPSSQSSHSKPASPSFPKKKSQDPGTMCGPNSKNAPKISITCPKIVWSWPATCWSGPSPTCARVTWAWWTTLRSGRQRNCPNCQRSKLHKKIKSAKNWLPAKNRNTWNFKATKKSFNLSCSKCLLP